MYGKKLLLTGAIIFSLLTTAGCSALDTAVQAGIDQIAKIESVRRETQSNLKQLIQAIFQSCFGGKNKSAQAPEGNQGADDIQEMEASEKVPSFVKDSDLFLYLAKSDFLIGEQGDLSFTVLYGSEITEPITISDETGALICTLENDGCGVAKGTAPVFEESPRFGALTAQAGGHKSDAAHFYIQPKVTDEMMDRLFQVGDDLSSIMETAGYEDPYSEDAFAFVQQVLTDHPDVAFVGENNGILLFETTDHLAGCYGLSADYENDLVFGGFSDISTNFEDWQEGVSVADRVVASGGPATNSQYLYTAPFMGDYLVDTASPMYSSRLDALAEHVDGTSRSVRGKGVYPLLRSGAVTDSGFWMHCTHGRPMLRSDGTNMLFSLLFYMTRSEIQDLLGTDQQMFYNSEQVLWEEAVTEETDAGDTRFVGADTYRLVYEVTADNRNRVWTSTRFFEDCLGDQMFDNTVIYFSVCYAFSDPMLQSLFTAHGASAFIGCSQSLDGGLAMSFWDQLTTAMGTPGEDGSYLTLQHALSSITYSRDDACVRELLETICSEKGYSADKTAETVEENLNRYMEAVTEAPITCTLISGGGRRVLSGTSKVIGNVFVETNPANGNAVEGVEDATVTLYRWLDHDFLQQGETQTDHNGIYELEDLDYGLYIAHAEKEDANGYGSIVVDKTGIQASPIYLGVILSGEVRDQDTGDPLPDTVVAFTSNLGYGGEAVADSEGFWEIFLPAVSYRADFSCPGYQRKSISISKAVLDGGTRHFPVKLKKQINYYRFIRDELLPDMGYASLETASRNVTPEQAYTSALGWDVRKGLLGADIADLDGDGIQDLLVYYFDQNNVSGSYSALYASLYTTSEQNEIYLVNTVLLSDFLNALCYHTIQTGLMEVGGKICLYAEQNSTAYFANGHELMYSWYCYDGAELRSLWQIGKTDGGTTDIAYSLLTYSDADQYNKQVLWADSLYRQGNPDKIPLTDGQVGQALETGFSLIGLSAPARVFCENAGYSVYSEKETFPSYWPSDSLKQSVQYQSAGSGSYQSRNMQVSVADLTDLKEHIAELDE